MDAISDLQYSKEEADISLQVVLPKRFGIRAPSRNATGDERAVLAKEETHPAREERIEAAVPLATIMDRRFNNFIGTINKQQSDIE